jgi:4-diphosphocytidyl-2C-methyl-D-erythritol kinase
MGVTGRRELVNDFEASVFKRYPAIAALKTALYDSAALYASICRSGSAVFGIFRSYVAADAVQSTLAEKSGIHVFRGRGLR